MWIPINGFSPSVDKVAIGPGWGMTIARAAFGYMLWTISIPAFADATPQVPLARESFQEPAFHPDAESDAHRIIVAASFLLLLGLGGMGTVFYARRGGLVRLKLAVDASPMRVLSARRVTSRLTLVKVRIDDRRTVVIADNGSHLLLVAETLHETPGGSSSV